MKARIQPTDMIFYVIIFLIFLSAMGILFGSQLIHKALFLLIILIVVAAVFIIAKAEFLGIAQLIIYVGGILILLLFGIIVTQFGKVEKKNTPANIPSFLLVSGFAYLLYFLIYSDEQIGSKETIFENDTLFNNSEQIGIALMTTHISALEFMAMFLLITLIGTVIIAGRKTN